jgi:alpha-tubulin suppressor-like RCC1 family protein
MTDRPTPTAVIGGLTFQALALGNDFTCGLTTGGVPYCWGYNDYGTLGKGDQGSGTNAVIPTPVSGDLRFTTISASVMHACGLLADGAAYCWGRNTGGELGNGSLTGSNVPVPVAGGLSFTTIEAGAFHTCALPVSGALTCWGWDDNGYIDSRTFNNGTSIHSKVPVTVPGGLTFLTVSEGDLHGCGLASDQVAYCWFYNGYGALGNGTFTGSYQPVAVR